MAWFLILLSLFSTPAFCAAVPSGVPSVQYGGVGTVTGGSTGSTIAPDSSTAAAGGYFILTGGIAGSNLSANAYYPFYKNGGPPTYIVTTGTRAYCTQITDVCSLASGYYQLVSSSTVFQNGAGSLGANSNYQNGNPNNFSTFTHPTASTEITRSWPYQFSSATFPGFQAGTANSYAIKMLCVER